MSGKTLRNGRIFRKGKALVLALDHGMGMGPQPGLTQPVDTIQKCVQGGVNAVLTTTGIAASFPESFREVGLIIRLDGAFTILHGGIERAVPCFSVEHAIQLGGDAVACMGFVGGTPEIESDSLAALASYAESCAEWQMPLMAEMIAFDNDFKPLVDSKNAALAVRTGVEYGADFIKTPLVDEKEDFSLATKGSFKPVLMLGGGKVSDEQLLTSVRKAMDEGASGAVIGRNIWQHDNPEKISKAISEIIHNDKSVSEAISISKL